MNIGIDANSLSDPRRTGIGRYAAELVRHLLPLCETHALYLYSALPVDSRLRAEFGASRNVFFREGRFPSRYLWQQTLLRFHAHRDPLDVYLAVDGLLPPMWRVPSVGVVHDLIWRHFPKTASLHVYWVFRLRLRASVRKARRVITDSRATREDLVSFAGIPAQKISIVHPGVSARFRRAEAPVIRATAERLGIRPPYILYVGNRMQHKNLGALMEAYARFVPSAGPRQGDCPGLVVAGAAKDRSPDALSAGESRDLRDGIRLLGYVADADLPALYSGAEFFVFPSLIEGFGFPILEAQACGTPVVTSDAYSLPEVGGDAAVYFNPRDVGQMADAIARVHGDPALRSTLQKRGIENVKRFSWDRTAQAVLSALVEAAAA
jgi:glycosyltransferase involved in cell wall biosynthesis